MRLGKFGLWIFVLAAAVFTLASFLPGSTQGGINDEDLSKIVNHNNRGVALLDQYKFKEAAAEFNQILQYSRAIPAAHVNLGIAYFYDQKYDEAVIALNEALSLNSDEIRAHYLLGLIYRNQDRVEEGITAFEAVRKQDPEDPSTNYYLGRLYMRERDYATAGEFFRKVIDREPYNASAHYNLATALGRSGKREDGRKEMDEFRRLQNLFGSTTVGLQYLEQGKYAVAVTQILRGEFGGTAAPSLPELHVTFQEVASDVGLNFEHAGPARVEPLVTSVEQLERELVPFMGSGAATHDYDGDGWLDLYLANAGPEGAQGALFRNCGNGVFEEKTKEAGILFSGKTMHAIWGDYDNDEFPDLYLVNYGSNVLFRNQQDGTFIDVTETTGTGDPSWGMGGAFVDFDHDGDLDIYVANFIGTVTTIETGLNFPSDLPGSENVLFRNNGDGTFEDVAASARLTGGQTRSTSLVTSDLDNSRDVDFYLLNHGADNLLLNNLRDGTFGSAVRSGAAGTGAGVGVGVGDFNRDGYVDLALPSLGPSESALLLNQGNSRYQSADAAMPASRLEGLAAHNMQFFDFDNDGDLDLLALGARLFDQTAGLSRGRNLHLFENRADQYLDVSEKVGLDSLKGQAVRGSSIADFDKDGDLDVVLTVNGGRPLFFRNEGGNGNNWIALRLHGTNSNKGAVGVKAEVQVGRLWQKGESFGGQGFLSQNSPLLHFGLGSSKSVDVVRLLWPNGVLQSEIDSSVNQIIELDELDRKGTSCPILYVWDGSSYRFQTDFLGGSAYGSLVSPGVFNYPDTDEYVKLRREDLVLKDGKVAITMNNQLEEVIFFDKVELVVVDHPRSFDVFPDEKLLPGPPYQDFKLFTSGTATVPVKAWDEKGHNVLDEISRIDRRYPEVTDSLPFKGYAELHELTLDLGEISGEHAVMLMHAWIDYADSSSNLAASQAEIELIPPYLQVQNSEGEWVTVLERMGFPAGLPKAMTVDLSGKFLSESRLVRIVTNMKIHWDQILVEAGAQRSDYRLHRVAPSSAHLHYKGYPEFASPDGRKPKVYLYDQPSTAEWKVHVGAYTKFGEVRPLLEGLDDFFVVTRSGDEMEILFDVAVLPQLRPGWVRDYIVYVDGFGKDMDPNSATPYFLGPLPFHGMTSFPYSGDEGYPDSEAHQEYLREWNTRQYYLPYPKLLGSKSAY